MYGHLFCGKDGGAWDIKIPQVLGLKLVHCRAHKVRPEKRYGKSHVWSEVPVGLGKGFEKWVSQPRQIIF